jgi:exopolyphosphatase / guanosine-5'-triphosphate,3'-diphosphate pyrophosphatase
VTRVAAVDCGTNSLRLLLADLDVESGREHELVRRNEIVRLGEGVDRSEAFTADALERTFSVLDDYAALIAQARPERIRVVATSAARDVSNRQTFVDGVRQRVGVDPEIISGTVEALLSYDGATRGLAGQEVARPIVVADLGGGSTELVSRIDDAGPVRSHSLDIGSVRLTERHLHDDPPTTAQVGSAAADIEAALASTGALLDDAGTLVAVSGTVTTMAALVLDLPAYDRARIHHARLPTPDLLAAVDRIVAMTVAERCALGFMHPGRADVIGGGALVLSAIVRRARVDETVVSEHDILDGVAWSMA